MGIFNKVMASALGVGATKIDTIVHTRNIMPGYEIQGICKIYGGKIEQYIREIAIKVYTSYEKEINDKSINVNECIQTYKLRVDKNISPKEVHEVDFSFTLSNKVPVTLQKSKVWLSTNLDIENGIDSSDKDYLKVDYTDCMRNVIDAIMELGFSLKEVENEYSKTKLNGFNFVQEFEFVPNVGEFRGKLDELELVFLPTDYYVELAFQVDRKVRGIKSFFSECVGLDETNVRIRLENSKDYSRDELIYEIGNLIRKYS